MSSSVLTKTQKPVAAIPAAPRSDALLRRRATFAPPEGASLDLAQYERSTITAPPDRAAGHNFGRISVFPPARVPIQPKLRINEPGDMYEQEADWVAEQVMRMSEPVIQRKAPCPAGASSCDEEEKVVQTKPLEITPLVQRQTEEVPEEEEKKEETLQTKQATGRFSDPTPHLASQIADLRGSGQPLPHSVRSFFESRFGHDFSTVRVHDDTGAAWTARSVNARAYTTANHIVFSAGQFSPRTESGRRLLAHELTHVVQQGAAPRLQYRATDKNGERQVLTNELHTGMANHLVQRWPGDGMVPPGDCSWASYLVLRGSVETAKAVVSTLGACSPGDSCLFLAAKIAAITAEIAARVALDATCFRGGDTGHRQQVQDKINMMNRCYRFFSNSNCPPELIGAMAVVVESARAVIAAAATAVAIALVVALIAAIIALAEVIAALAAAAAEAAAIGAAAAAMIAVLVLIRDELAPGE